jgi:hypothetical protein
MKCLRCTGASLVTSYRQGIEIDHCPQCHGVWLDRGELDKLIELSSAAVPAAGHPHHRARTPADFADSDFDHDHGQGPRGQRQRSWLSNIFD